MIIQIPVFIIALKDTTKLETELRNIGFVNVHRFNAINGKLLTPEQIKAITSTKTYYFLNEPRSRHEEISTKGEIGCYLSHTLVYETIKTNNLESAIILEEDAELSKDFIDKFKNFNTYRELYQPDLVFFGICQRYMTKVDKLDDKVGILHGMFFGAHGYWITNKTANILLERAYPIEVQADIRIAMESDINGLRSLVYEPGIINTPIKTPTIHNFCLFCYMDDCKWYILGLIIITVMIFVFLTLKKNFPAN